MKPGYKDNSGVEGVRRAMGVTGEEDKEDMEEKEKFLQRRTRRRRNSCGRTDERMGLLKQEVLAALKSKRLKKMNKLFEGWLQQSVYLLYVLVM